MHGYGGPMKVSTRFYLEQLDGHDKRIKVRDIPDYLAPDTDSAWKIAVIAVPNLINGSAVKVVLHDAKTGFYVEVKPSSTLESVETTDAS